MRTLFIRTLATALIAAPLGTFPAWAAEETYRGDLKPLNDHLTPGSPVGYVQFVVDDGKVRATVEATGVPPDMMHLQHLHGFVSGKEASCPDPKKADANDDGIVDLRETERALGITLIPLHENPHSLAIKADTYPKASATGQISYTNTDSVAALEKSLKDKHQIAGLQFDTRVMLIHGVPKDVALPRSVESLPGVPAHVTVPIACAEIQKVTAQTTASPKRK